MIVDAVERDLLRRMQAATMNHGLQIYYDGSGAIKVNTSDSRRRQESPVEFESVAQFHKWFSDHYPN